MVIRRIVHSVLRGGVGGQKKRKGIVPKDYQKKTRRRKKEITKNPNWGRLTTHSHRMPRNKIQGKEKKKSHERTSERARGRRRCFDIEKENKKMEISVP